MSETIDELYERLLRVTTEIDRLPQDHPNRKRLEHERDEMRARAAELSAAGRHPVSVEREIESLERRLHEIESMQITEGYQERRGGKNLQDPGAYSSTINRLLEEHHDQEVTTLRDRIAYLKQESPDDGAEETD
ncbi:MAG: hypothetical protein BMS9Abin17_0406 [Acidimicrobiia bacterium]|nr:MAG: hypothetical protein BMS9Abin17_0406 [Acidimicrobiia bacterium]